MRDRCRNPNHQAFKNYGGRGIKVCERWQHDFAAFLADVGPRPSPNHWLDRYPNNDGHYEPGNTRWATRKESAANKRPRKRIDQFTTAELKAELMRRVRPNRVP